jgi:hypothetical protein
VAVAMHVHLYQCICSGSFKKPGNAEGTRDKPWSTNSLFSRAECGLPDLGDDINGGLLPFSAEWKAAVQKRVDAFVVSLPLSHTQQDVEIEEKIAERLYDDEIAAAAIKSRLSEWYAQIPGDASVGLLSVTAMDDCT